MKESTECHEHAEICPICQDSIQRHVESLVSRLEAYGYLVSIKRKDI